MKEDQGQGVQEAPRAPRASWDPQGLPASLALQGVQDQLEILDNQALREITANQEQQVPQEVMEEEGQPVHREILVDLVKKDSVVMTALMVTLDLTEALAPLESLVPVATPDPPATTGQPGRMDPPGTKVRVVPQDPQESPADQVDLAPRDQQDRLEHRDFLELMDNLEMMDNLETKVLPDQ